MSALPPISERFIETEAVGRSGEGAELEVWKALKLAFSKREGFGYWRFPVFARYGHGRKEPDILLGDRELGLCIIEVKSIRIHNIDHLHGHLWKLVNYRVSQENPYEQAEQQMWQLLGYFNPEPSLREKVTARVMVALPYIRREQWEERGFHKLPSQPPILFKEDLRNPLEAISAAPTLKSGPALDDDQWERLQKVLMGKPLFVRHREVDRPQIGRAVAVHMTRKHLYDLDLQQEKIGKQIPPGPQRIRGIAGSGKTVMLCQKAALMHLRYPDWDIALTFFTQSLYDLIQHNLNQWLRHYTSGDLGYSPDNPKLRVLHAWGRAERPGLYKEIARHNGLDFYWVSRIPKADQGSPLESYAWVVRKLLEEARAKGKTLKPLFDAILVDEGQDLVFDERFKIEGKQPFYAMAWESLRPVQNPQAGLFDKSDTVLENETNLDTRRLIWAYDEAQSLDSLLIPTSKELFGPGFEKMVAGSYPGGILKSEIMKSCYRTPGPIILAAAHALGMGLLRPEGVVSSITTQEGWKDIGYEVEGQFSPPGQAITLTRPDAYTPNPIPKLWELRIVSFTTHQGRFEEVEALAERIKKSLEEGLAPSRETMIVLLTRSVFDFRPLAVMVGEALRRAMSKGLSTTALPCPENLKTSC
ncbi:MAG: NERD domain-containing protein [Thermaceae bacterium]|nr:NERD domain-containing protein [Thermaceae bacterium]